MMDRRRFLMTAAATSAFAAGGGAAALAQSAPAQQLSTLLDTIFQSFLSDSPELLTSLGLDQGPMAGARSRLSDNSPAEVARQRDRFIGWMNELRAIDRSQLTGMSAVDYDTITFFGDTVQTGYAQFDYGVPGSPTPYRITQLTGNYTGFLDFMDSQHPVRTTEDAEAYLARLEAFPTQLDYETDYTREDFGRGVVPPDFILQRAGGQLAGLLATDPGQSILTTSVQRRATEAGLSGDWAGRAEAIVRERIYPALQRQADLLAGALPGATHDAGVWRLPDGDAYYNFGARYYTTTDYTGADIHRIGLEQVAEISARADELLQELGYTQGTVGERIAAIGRDPAQLYPNTDEGRAQLLADLNAQMADMQARLPQYFGRLPRAPVEVRRVPEFTEAGAPGGYYQAAALDGSRPGAYYINLRDTAEWPRFTLPTLTYHEASPGHHFQISIAQEVEGIPMLRKVLGFSAYSEGWALYAEQLADEMGVYADNPLGKVGYLQSFLFRAVRLVVDSGLHYRRWSREEAIRYMVDTLGDQESSVTTEVERYCVWPGQASSYKIGHTVFDALRTQARQALGDRFDIRGFHDTALASGGIPLAVLERVINDWVAAQQA